jgi:hypothetical protein
LAGQIADDLARNKWLAHALEFDAQTVAVDAADAVARQLSTEDAAPEWPRRQDVRRYRDAVLTRIMP